MANTSIIIYKDHLGDYLFRLAIILEKIRKINKIHNEFLSGTWDNKIKYRSSFYRNLQGLQPKHYQDRGKWVDFIINTEHFNTEANSILTFSIESLAYSQIRLILLFFWRDIILKLNINTTFKLQLKINFSGPIEDSNKITPTGSIHKNTPIIRSIGSVNIYNTTNFSEALSYFEYHLNEHADQYITFPAEAVILTYNVCHEDSILNTIDLKHKATNNLLKKQTKDKMQINRLKLKLAVKNLPLTTDLSKWGAIKVIEGHYPYKFKFKETKLTINTSSDLFNYKISIKGVFIEDKKIFIQRVSVVDKKFKAVFFNFIDIIYNSITPDSFIRIYNDVQEVYHRGERVLIQKRKKVKYFTPVKKNKSLSKNFITMDLETKNINGVLVPYCVSIFDGKVPKSFYITDYKSSSEMLKASIQYVLKRKYNKHRVYLHNFSHFDGIFLMEEIISITGSNRVKPVIRDGRIINLRVEFAVNQNNKNKYYVEFRDSYLLLTTSLESLGNSFSLNKGKLEQKLPFPYSFINEANVDYSYIGPMPEFKYYGKINESEYNQLQLKLKSKSKNIGKWDLKKETIKYCEQDCKTLYYAIKEFSKLIYFEFRTDISQTPTVSSLAFKVYRALFFQEKKKIPVLKGLVYDFIYQAYYGGAVDSYIPFGENIKGYDVNALYPTSMKNNLMPVGNPYYFEGDLTLIK